MGDFDATSMATTYDAEADAAYLYLLPVNNCERIERTIDVGHGVHLDIDANDIVVGIEILGAAAAHRIRKAAGEGGRMAVREHGDELRRLADS